jgi:hypothetical protein
LLFPSLPNTKPNCFPHAVISVYHRL